MPWSEFLRCYAKGVDIVFGVRRSRDTDGLLKRVTAQAFYGLMHAMGANVIRNHAEFSAAVQARASGAGPVYPRSMSSCAG